MLRILPTILFIGLTGCEKHFSHPATEHEADHGHAHERDKLLLADLGPYHAGLTAHLSSRTGHELDVFLETADEAHTAVPLPLKQFTGRAESADGKEHELSFEPTELDERKDDPTGKCSHFVARAPWIEPDSPIVVTAEITVNGKPIPVRWTNFLPRKYAHHIE